jgi:hypothetical protein
MNKKIHAAGKIKKKMMRARFYIKIKRLPRFFVDGFSSFLFFSWVELLEYTPWFSPLSSDKRKDDESENARRKWEMRVSQVSITTNEKGKNTKRRADYSGRNFWTWEEKRDLLVLYHDDSPDDDLAYMWEKQKQLSLYLKSISVNV